MIYVALPNIGNIVIYLIKEGSLGFTIGLVDVFGKANSLNQNSYNNYILEIYTALALIYWFASILLEKGMKLIERRVSYGR
jgi:L-cystine transport system permease protein